ncbi:MAG: hypothetical protein AB7U82_14575 [Blastocatellales bacterium]
MNKPKLIKRGEVLKQEQTDQPQAHTANTPQVQFTVSEWVRKRQARRVNPRVEFAALFAQPQTV